MLRRAIGPLDVLYDVPSNRLTTVEDCCNYRSPSELRMMHVCTSAVDETKSVARSAVPVWFLNSGWSLVNRFW